jgi:hypothetical protein
MLLVEEIEEISEGDHLVFKGIKLNDTEDHLPLEIKGKILQICFIG